MSLFTLTDGAKEQITNLCKEHNTHAVRLSVKGGGCAGFQYEWGFATEDQIEESDELINLNGGNFVVDSMSVMYVAGTEIDYVREAFGSQFVIRNPNATSSCGCGESFAV